MNHLNIFLELLAMGGSVFIVALTCIGAMAVASVLFDHFKNKR